MSWEESSSNPELLETSETTESNLDLSAVERRGFRKVVKARERKFASSGSPCVSDIVISIWRLRLDRWKRWTFASHRHRPGFMAGDAPLTACGAAGILGWHSEVSGLAFRGLGFGISRSRVWHFEVSGLAFRGLGTRSPIGSRAFSVVQQGRTGTKPAAFSRWKGEHDHENLQSGTA
jgi:hypothetical protein